MDTVDEEEYVMWSAQRQREAYGDEPPFRTLAPNLPSCPIRIPTYETDVLRGTWSMLTDEEKRLFSEKYGCLFDLIDVPFPGVMMRELLKYWDPQFHCFTINDIDISPLAEEYGSILRLRDLPLGKVYTTQSRPKVEQSLSRILGVTRDKLKGQIQIGTTGEYLPIRYLLGYIRNRCTTCHGRVSALELILYGVVLYPSAIHFISENAIRAFVADYHRANPTYAILAETFVALDSCYQLAEETLYGSASLLVTWIFGHLKPSPELGIPNVRYSKCFHGSTSTIAEFIQAEEGTRTLHQANGRGIFPRSKKVSYTEKPHG